MQTKIALRDVTAEQMANVVIAYEPIWAIGTGKTATSEQAEEVCREIRAIIRDIYGARAARSVSILYRDTGGARSGRRCSTELRHRRAAKNAAELLAQPDVDGGLIGGASLKPADFAAIIAATGAENE